MKDVENTTISDLAAAIENAAIYKSGSRLEIDFDRYQDYLDDPDMGSDQKAEIVTALWTIISAFVQLGFGVHPAQQTCGKHGIELDQEGKSESTESTSNIVNQDEKTDAPVI